MKFLERIALVLFSLYGFIAFTILLLVLLPAFFIASLYGKVKGGNMIYAICGIWADIWLFLIGIRVPIIHEAKPSEERPCIFIANHISYLDIPMIVKVIREPVRVLGKQEMAGIPIFGFVYRNAVIMVNRKDAAQRARSVGVLKKMLMQGISIFIFPEGTFNETDHPLKSFYDGAFRIAIETQTSIQPIIFPDTVKRLWHGSVFSLNPGTSRAVYLPMVSVKDYDLQHIPELKNKVFDEMADALNRYQKNSHID